MIEHFENKLKESGFHITTDLATLKHTICDEEVSVYDFDQITSNIGSLLKISTPKSVDAIFVKSESILYFIEMSSMKNVINRIKSSTEYSSNEAKINAIQKKFKSTYFEFVDKAYESYISILAFWGHNTQPHHDYNIHTGFYSYFMDKMKLHIGCILLTDFDSRDELIYNFAYLMDANKFCARRFGEMTLYNCEDFKSEIVNS